MATMTPGDWDVLSVSKLPYPTQGVVFSPMQDVTYTPPDQHDLSQYTIIAPFDAPMSFRERHRFLHGIYNSYPDPDSISAKTLDSISRSVDLSMEEVLSWFGDEKIRREALLANQLQDRFPLSPAETTTPGSTSNSTLTMSQYTSPGTMSQIDDILSPSTVSAEYESCTVVESLTAGLRPKRGRPAKGKCVRASNSLLPLDMKRQKLSIQYPCPDCNNILTADRWSEHVKRTHFPDQVWECPKTNKKNGKLCDAKPYFRSDNFGAHLEKVHCCNEKEISRLKIICRFPTKNLFHQICGFCNDTFDSRDESIEHIKDHFGEISARAKIPSDLGISEWKEKCGSDHSLKRGIHYHFSEETAHGNLHRDQEDDSDEGPGQDNSNTPPHDRSQNRQPDNPPDKGNDDTGDRSGFYYCQDDYQQYSTAAQDISSNSASCFPPSKTSVFGLEGFALPFTSLRSLGSGGHSLADEVTSTSSKETFVRKSMPCRRRKSASSSSMTHLRNELATLKNLNHPHLMKYIGAYTDLEYSHIIMSPVADQNLADYMRSPKPNQSENFIRWMGCLTSALTYLHDHNVKHLDIKPQNILVKGDNILLADFGVAASFYDQFKRDPNSLPLTSTYSAPESIFYGQLEYSSDVFSLGCVFSEMITQSFGCSLKEFEDMRSRCGSSAFFLALSETKDWIISLPERRLLEPLVPRPNLMVRNIIMDMLAEIPQERPKARKLRDLFTHIDHCFCKSCLVVERAPDRTTNVEEISLNANGSLCVASPATKTIKSFSDAATLSDPSSTSSAASSKQFSELSYLDGMQTNPETALSFEDFPLYPSPTCNYDSYDQKFGGQFEDFIREMLTSDTNAALVDPSILHLPYDSRLTEYNSVKPLQIYSLESDESTIRQPALPRLSSHISSLVVEYPVYNSHYSNIPYTYSSPRRPSLTSYNSFSNEGRFASDESREKGRCTYPECGKVFKDLKAHILTHQNERPQKCPIQTCDYHIKGFARKYDQMRHTLTHYKGTMICGFCPATSGKSFNRADVFKRHLTSVHSVEQHLPIKCKKSTESRNKTLSGRAPDTTGKCSTCSSTFSNAQNFYEHLDECVLKIVHQEEPSAEACQEYKYDQVADETPRNFESNTDTKFIKCVDEDISEITDKNFDNGDSRCGPSQSESPLLEFSSVISLIS